MRQNLRLGRGTALLTIYLAFALPFCVWMMRGHFTSIPVEIDEEALWAGRQLEKLNYEWFEEPLRDYQFRALAELSHRLEIPRCVAETGRDTLYDVVSNITFKTGSFIHARWQRKVGIRGLLNSPISARRTASAASCTGASS